MRRVVVTGIGLVTPLGIGTEQTWRGLIEGRSAIGPINSSDASSEYPQMGAELPHFEPEQFIRNRRNRRLMTPGDQFAFAASSLALADADVDTTRLESDRAGLFIGSIKEMCDSQHLLGSALEARGSDGKVDRSRYIKTVYASIYPLFFVEGLPQSSLFFLSEAYNIKGANAFFIGTADASAMAVGRAFRAIKRGEVDIALAGGFDQPLYWWYRMKLQTLGVTADSGKLGVTAYRPYDKNRSGAIMGEGAAFLVLEDYEHACKRGVQIYAEVTGFGSGFDTYRVLTPDPEGKGLALAITGALREAETRPENIGYIASHGSGTRRGDLSEAIAIRSIAGAAVDSLAGSSIKPATGHLGTAAGALNVAVSALALRHQALPPTLNLHNPDSACQFDWIAHQAREAHIKESLALARGLEGGNVAVTLSKIF